MQHTQPAPIGKNGIVAALDIGTTKVTCLIARHEGDRPPRVIGSGYHVSGGVRAGAVVDMDLAEAAVRAAVGAAEEMAQVNISGVIVNLSGEHFKSRLVSYEVDVSGHEISDSDVRKVLDLSHIIDELPEDDEIIHAIPVGYSIDGNRGVRDPRGMFGNRMGANLHVVTASVNAMRNIDTCIRRCQLNVDGHVVAPYASALSAVVEDEMKLGVTLIDMGGGTTNIAVFFDGELVHADCIPVGGENVTKDIAQMLCTPVQHAERMKTLYGNCIPTAADDHEVMQVALIGEEQTGETNPVPRSMLVGIIRPRLEETFELVRERLKVAGFDKMGAPRVALTGGASLLPGVRELAGEVLGKPQVRMAKPRYIEGMAEATSGPSFATCVGMLNHVFEMQHPTNSNRTYRPLVRSSHRLGRLGRLGRIARWLKENV